MRRLVVDASVACKWFLRDAPREPNLDAALALLRAVGTGRVGLIQPPHFRAEMCAVLIREAPTLADECLHDLLDLEMQVVESDEHYALAMRLADRYRQHVFDTLYHAVALRTPGATLVTADSRYLRAAGAEGGALELAEFALGV